MPDGGTTAGRIGPNAILQLRDPVARLLGPDALRSILELTHVEMPTGRDMIPETDVQRVHLALLRMYPEVAPVIRNQSGTGTGAYIRAHRIPAKAAFALGLMPAFLGERLLTRAIVCHAWTFCGSGSVSARRIRRGVEIAIASNPLVDPLSDKRCQCDWHEAVFRDLYASLLRRDYEVRETECCGSGAPACRFNIRRV